MGLLVLWHHGWVQRLGSTTKRSKRVRKEGQKFVLSTAGIPLCHVTWTACNPLPKVLTGLSIQCSLSLSLSLSSLLSLYYLLPLLGFERKNSAKKDLCDLGTQIRKD
jgi:hypothetical protein